MCQNIFQEYLEFINLVDLSDDYKKYTINNWEINLDDFKKNANFSLKILIFIILRYLWIYLSNLYII